jgi:hypothetical protein
MNRIQFIEYNTENTIQRIQYREYNVKNVEICDAINDN